LVNEKLTLDWTVRNTQKFLAGPVAETFRELSLDPPVK